MYDHIPQEMREYAQWVVWRYEGTNGHKPTKVPYDPKTGYLMSVNDPSTWADFQTAITASASYNGIGFVLSEHDPYAFIDLDDTEGDAIALQRQMFVFDKIQSYSELSPSGQGLHIITRGQVPSGRRRSKIEVYSSQRYMTMTGRVYRNMPITENQWFLDILWHEMGGPSNAPMYYTGDEPANEDDQTVIERALAAVNGEKFRALLEGRWNDLYPSQSEADYAFIDIIAFYTKNREQITRIFRSSPLGQRRKAQRDDYVNTMVNRSFDRMVPPIDLEGFANKVEEYFAGQKETDAPMGIDAPALRSSQGHDAPVADSIETVIGQNVHVNTVPSGLVQDLASFFYRSAPRPVPEIAIAAAVGFMAGICGRAWNVSGTGLNQYILLLAHTGTGKAAMSDGISKIVSAVRPKVPAITKFIGPAEIASGQALVKYLSENSQCFVSVMGEFGLLLKSLASPYINSAQIMLKRTLLDLYAKSGQFAVLEPTIYSDKAKNTVAIQSPAFTILGEAEPESFYQALDENLVATGLLPRILRVEYEGPRPPMNENHLFEQVPDDIAIRVAQLAVYSHELMQKNIAINVQLSPEAADMFKRLDKWCDAQINQADRDVYRQLWNRAHIKSMKLAALVAVGNNSTHPIIQPDAAAWAISVVVNDTHTLLKRFERGDVGEDTTESRQINEIKRVIRKYVQADFTQLGPYRTKRDMHEAKVVPYSYIQQRLVCAALFRKDKMGATNAIQRGIAVLTKSDVIREIPQSEMQSRFGGSRQKAYAVSDPSGLV